MHKHYAFLAIMAALTATPVNATTNEKKALKKLETILTISLSKSGSQAPEEPVKSYTELPAAAEQQEQSDRQRIISARRRVDTEASHHTLEQKFETLRKTLNSLQTLDNVKKWLKAFVYASKTVVLKDPNFDEMPARDRKNLCINAKQLLTDAYLQCANSFPQTEEEKLIGPFQNALHILDQLEFAGEADINRDELIIPLVTDEQE